MGSNNVTSLGDHQLSLAIARQPNTCICPIELIRSRKSSGAAFTLACDTSGLEDKEIYSSIISKRTGKPIDAGYFSNMKKGEATPNGDDIEQFCQRVGNRIYPEWIAYTVGCTLLEIETETHRQLKAEQSRREDAEKENALLRSLLAGKVGQ